MNSSVYIYWEMELLWVLRFNSINEFLLKTTFSFTFFSFHFHPIFQRFDENKIRRPGCMPSLYLLCFLFLHCFSVENEMLLFLFCLAFVNGMVNCVKKSWRERWTFYISHCGSFWIVLSNLCIGFFLFRFSFTECIKRRENHQARGYI